MQIKLSNKDQGIFVFQLDQNNYIKFCPQRGGVITNWISDGKEILYFDEKRFIDKTKSIRGGIPILFPICGNLNTSSSVFGTDCLQLSQHGFGLHPYFNVSDFKNLEFIDYPLNCQNQEKNIISNTLDELKNINLGVDLLMYTSGKSVFRDKIFKRQVTLNHPYPFDLGVIWSDPPRRMICLEPWTSPRNSFIDGFRNIMIPSNDNQRFDASIHIKSLK